MEKAKADGEHPYLSLLEYRNSTVRNIGSPVLSQIKFSATIHYRTASSSDDRTKESHGINPESKGKNRKYNNKNVKDLPKLQPNDSVRI